MANQEAFTLDGLALNDQTTFAVDSVSWPPPRQRQDWIGGADSETQLLFRKPKHENRKVTLRVAVIPQTTMDLALAKVAQVVDKLDKAGQYTDGIGLVWTPATATLSCTFDVLAGEITDLPIDWENGWLALAPSFTIELTCKPYARGTRVVYGTTTTNSTPLQVLELPSIPGDIAALGELIVTDNATQARRHVEWGLEGPLTYNAATSLLVDSDDMVTTGFSGVGAVTTGAYDPNATGNNSITLTLVAGVTTALCGTGNLLHVGVFRVKARVQSGSLSNQFRLSWKAGDGPMNHNPWVTPISTSGWVELDLGTITIPATVVGTQRWTGQLEVLATTTSPGTAVVDYLILVPQADGYGQARGVYSFSTGTATGYDAFIGTTAGVALGVRTAPLGGSWATSGDTTDFLFDDQLTPGDGVESIKRVTNAGETVGRFAILGSTSYTDMQVDMRVRAGVAGSFDDESVIVRWTDSSNYARLSVPAHDTLSVTVKLEQVVAGTPTTLATYSWFRGPAVNHRLRLIAYASGRLIGAVYTDDGVQLFQLGAISSAIATGGALASGKPGIHDQSGVGTATARRYTEFQVSTPAAEPIVIYSTKTLQVRYDDAIRDDSTGTYTGRPSSYRGSRFLVPAGTSRIMAKARRNDVVTALDDQVTDSTKIQVAYTPRFLAVPR